MSQFEDAVHRAFRLSEGHGVRYQVYGRKNHGVWGYTSAPTFALSKFKSTNHVPSESNYLPPELVATAPESRTLDQVLPDSLVVRRHRT